MADLTTLAAVRLQLGFAVTETGDDTLITSYVSDASQMIETYCKRTLVAANGTLTFDVCPPDIYGRRLFFHEDVLGVYLLTNGDGETIASANYRLLPNNGTPKYGLDLIDADFTFTDSRFAAVTVAGTLGMFTSAAIPADLSLAATKLAAWLYQTRDNRGDVTRFADGSMTIPSEAPAVVLNILDKRYVKDRLYV